ncbi:diaminopropionate ammonia-lyase [Rhodopila sp.]|jgi:diaminopropionate ammonia-lyase|uniref:diaminopropionate ammonia-lyase n=1 Tax=Rhodopila sp. TaxID=2480087 RepID=UPI002C37394F|nr:diaminopropionate ammonia-lyase [Rhodopila sp.]HVZ10260.1 diaminopropionate ammonia-lyase [Rhodopila sp.]
MRLFLNPRMGVPGLVVLPAGGFRRAKAEITTWDGYAPTPLHDLPALAARAGVAAIRLKDEGTRFGLGSFKALGGAYAVAALLSAELARRGVAPRAGSAELASGRHADATGAITVTCATDGNHGRAVAWGARRFHCRCVIFVHETVSQPRVDAIAAFGAKVRRVPGTYDDAVREADRQARANGWFVVSDTAYAGYTEVPRSVMQGYRLMADEAADQWDGAPPTHVFIQAGVGGAAAAVSVQTRARFDPSPALIVVEPDNAACLLLSAERGAPATVHGDLDTIMAGLACGEPSLLAWQELERAATAFMAIPDQEAARAMRILADQKLVIGESGVAGVAACLLACGDADARRSLGLSSDSRILLFGTEGATDPEMYRRIVDAG